MDFNKIKELTFELEGLLEISDSIAARGEDVARLISRKLAEIQALVDLPAPPAESDSAELPGEAAPSRVPLPQDSPDDANVPPVSARRSLFNLNDRYLYSRELFKGSLTDFDRSLKEIAGYESFEEAEEYFFTEWGWNEDNPVALDFLEKIKRYYV